MSTLSRRSFLKSLTTCTACAAASGLIPGAGVQLVNALSPRGRRLVMINLGGGCDTLGMLQPDIGELAARRPTLFREMSDTTLIRPISGNLGVHASFNLLETLYQNGELTIVQKCGYQNLSRSHDEAEDAYARGVRDYRSSVNSGWINRIGEEYFPNESFGVIDFTGGHFTARNGAYRGTYLRNLSDFGFDGQGGQSSAENQFRQDTLFSLNRDWPTAAAQIGARGSQEGIKTIDQSAQVVQSLAIPTGYPNSDLGRQLRDIDAAMSLREAGIFYARTGGYDTHANQQDPTNPNTVRGMVSLLGTINAALTTFIASLRANGRFEDTVIVIVSEFGRTTDENASFGTDHGGAASVLIISPLVRGGVIAPYTSSDFTPDKRWLDIQVNYVDVLGDVIRVLGWDPNRVIEGGVQNLNIFA